MTETVVPGLAKFGARLPVVVAVAPDADPVRHASRAAQVRQTLPLVARQQDTGISGLFDDGQIS